MARDNSPQERQRQQLARKLERRASYDRILIVCEGSKTEPNYLREIRAYYRLRSANVVVRPSESGTAPLQVVECALSLFEGGDRHKNIQRRDAHTSSLCVGAGHIVALGGCGNRFRAFAYASKFFFFLGDFLRGAQKNTKREERIPCCRRQINE